MRLSMDFLSGNLQIWLWLLIIGSFVFLILSSIAACLLIVILFKNRNVVLSFNPNVNHEGYQRIRDCSGLNPNSTHNQD